MVVTIDKAGRMVIPKPLRERLNLKPGSKLEAKIENGHFIADPITPKVYLKEQGGRLLAASDEPMPIVSQEELLELIDQSRQWPHNF